MDIPAQSQAQSYPLLPMSPCSLGCERGTRCLAVCDAEQRRAVSLTVWGQSD